VPRRRSEVPRELALAPFRGSGALAAGLVTRKALRGPSYVRLFPDIYLAAGDAGAASHRVWCQAAALFLPPGGAIGGLSAARLWGVDLLARHEPPVSVVLPHEARLHRRERLTVLKALLPAEDLTRTSGVTVTPPARTALDLGRTLSTVDAVIALDAMLHRRLITKPGLRQLIEARTRLNGLRGLTVALERADGLAESPMETRVRLLLGDAGLPVPVLQHKIYHRGRFVARVDFAYREQRVVIEYEGDQHRERSAFRFDLARVNDLIAAGWYVLRVTADDVYVTPSQLIGRIRTALALRSGAVLPRRLGQDLREARGTRPG
jgi:hypothetical protein